MRIDANRLNTFSLSEKQDTSKRIDQYKKQLDATKKGMDKISKILKNWQGPRNGTWIELTDTLKSMMENYKMILQEIAKLEAEERKHGRMVSNSETKNKQENQHSEKTANSKEITSENAAQASDSNKLSLLV